MTTLSTPTLFSASDEPIARRLVDGLRHAIVTMQLQPGEKLSEQDIARRFGVSRQPVREAFIKLADAGLVKILPQRGTLVVKISVEGVTNARFVREAIECAVVREAARLRDAPSLDALRQCLEDTRQALQAGNGDRLFSLDEEFHQTLAKAANRHAAWRVVMEQKAQMDRVRYLDLGDAIPMQVVLDQHIVITEAIIAGDPVAAEAAIRTHLAEILISLPKLRARWPELFDDSLPTP